MLDVLGFLAIDNAEPRLHDDVRLAIGEAGVKFAVERIAKRIARVESFRGDGDGIGLEGSEHIGCARVVCSLI